MRCGGITHSGKETRQVLGMEVEGDGAGGVRKNL